MVSLFIFSAHHLFDDRTGNVPLEASTTGQALIGVFENAGRPNFGKTIDRPSGLLDLRISPLSSAAGSGVRSSRGMPHFGQSPGTACRTSGCMGHV